MTWQEVREICIIGASLLVPNITRMVNSRRMRWAEHVLKIGEKRNGYRILVGKPE
jgi:hypothetical protein